MKKTTLLKNMFFVLCFLIINLVNAQETKQKQVFGRNVKPENIDSRNGYVRCISTEYEEYLQEIDPKRQTREQFEAWIKPIIEKQKELQAVSSESGGIIYIPVVVHVIHNGDAYGTQENITDEQVQSQITVMTQDYRRMMGTPGFNSSSVGADTNIEFVLAKVDPNGNPTNGIDRVNLCQDSFSTDEINNNVKPETIWNPSLYMNMWSVNFSDSTLLGYAQFPSSSGLGGLNANGGLADTDGVVAGYSFFGSSALATGNFQAPFDRGRTMTHEVGHFLGLLHTFQGGCAGENNSSGDFCADTPAVGSPNFGCSPTNSCPTGSSDMIQNYMDYTDDTCMNIFTLEQKQRITAVMNNSPRRASLRTSTKDIAIPLFANDAEVKIENSCGNAVPTCAQPNPPMPAKVISLYNRGTSNLTSATISYNIDGGTNYTNNWTGNLAPNKFVYVTLANTGVNGALTATVTSVNGGTDQRASNNTAVKTFGGSSSTLDNYNYTTYNFTLVGDRYGAETSWTLKNSSGTTLYSGGPYTNLTTNTTQNLVTNQAWTLPANGCYTFTINDSYGDGICCAYGAGSYTITTNSGATTVANGGTFGSTESKAFSNNALGLGSFETLNDVYVYPNPTKDILNVAVPNGINPDTISIHNYLGQLVSSKNISSINDLNISTGALSNGVYLITVSKGNETKTLRFIKE